MDEEIKDALYQYTNWKKTKRELAEARSSKARSIFGDVAKALRTTLLQPDFSRVLDFEMSLKNQRDYVRIYIDKGFVPYSDNTIPGDQQIWFGGVLTLVLLDNGMIGVCRQTSIVGAELKMDIEQLIDPDEFTMVKFNLLFVQLLQSVEEKHYLVDSDACRIWF